MRTPAAWSLLLLLACNRVDTPAPAVTAPGVDGTALRPTDAAPLRREMFATVLGRPLGTVAIVREPLAGGGERWTTTTTLTLALDDPGESSKTTEIVDVSDYGPGHVFRSSEETTTEDGVVESLTTRVDGEVLVVDVRGPSHHSEHRLPIPADFTSDLLVFERLRAEVDAGATLPHGSAFSSFDDESQAFERNTLTLLERVRFELAGTPVDAWKVESRDGEDERTVAVLDADGLPLRIEVGVFVAQVGAAAPAPAGEPPKLSSYLDVSGRVPTRTDHLKVAVSVDGDDGTDAAVFRDTAYQGVARDGGRYELTLHAVRGDGLAARPLPLADVPVEVRPFLAPTTTSQSDDPDLVARARAIVGAQTDARAAAIAITAWVHEHLGKRDGTRGAATAVETMAAGFGDCTEHAALTVALLRAVGLPARNAGGLVLVPGLFTSDAGYHAWVEVWLGDWVAMDPALGNTEVSAHYMLLGYDEPGMSSGAGALSRLIGRTRIAVVE
ncbi:MAG: transglutaminase domain-containing protein [Myxococcales bacterium]|nr:transglutaminase domain-containing protein [Myxococcales bacterium]